MKRIGTKKNGFVIMTTKEADELYDSTARMHSEAMLNRDRYLDVITSCGNDSYERYHKVFGNNEASKWIDFDGAYLHVVRMLLSVVKR